MALESLDDKTTSLYNNEKDRMNNAEFGCKIFTVENSVHVQIPLSSSNIYKELVFSKADMRKLLEDLFTS
jgi:hypothetical protein